MKYIFVIIGGGLGVLLRYIIASNIGNKWNGIFPLGTFVINISGCFIMGLLYGLFERWLISPNLRLFIFVGLLGGYTTFSSYSLETFKLFQATENLTAIFNLLFSNIFGILLLILGYIMSQIFINLFK